MLARLLKFLGVSGDASTSPGKRSLSKLRDEDIPRYPPFVQGLPVIAVDRLMHTQEEIIDRIQRTIGNQTYFDQYYIPVIERFAAYAHLLPASQSHHHRGAGGLFRHSLEVALYALQSAEKALPNIAQTPAKRREMETSWQLTVFLAALCHDAGKPVTDMTIANHNRSNIWRPIRESLYAWATRSKVESYYLDWREGRNRQHTVMANLVADRIIGTETLAGIEEISIEMIIWLMESLNSSPSAANPVHDLVIKADRTSVERDLKTIGATMAGYDLGVPVERMLTDIMRRLIKESIWLVNEPGARVWKLAGDTYLVWPASGEDMARVIREEKMPGLAHTPEGILDMLVERDIVQIREGHSPYWKIVPACLKEKIADIRLQAIRIKDEAIISTLPLQSTEGEVADETNVALLENQEMATRESQMDSVSAFSARSSQQLEKTNAISTVNQKPSPTLQESQPTQKEAASLSHPVLPEGLDLDFPDNEAGRILQVLRDAVKTKRKQWGHDVLLNDDGYLLIRWPDAFSDCTLPLKSILDSLSDQRWLCVDPVTPWKKVIDAEINGQTIKVIRLEKAISAVFVRIPGKPVSGSSNSHPETQSTKPETGIKQSPPSQQSNPASKVSISKQGTASDNFPSLDELLAVVRAMEGLQTNQDGWLELDRKILAKAVRAAGYRFTVVLLNKLIKDHPDRLSNQGTIFRCRL